MSFLDLARSRYSCRKYRKKEVEEEKILKILEAGRIAPSACNIQPWRFIVVKSGEARKKLNASYQREWFHDAPVALVVCGNHSESWRRKDGKDHCDVDAAIAADHMTLQASELGLASCWICNFDPKLCREALALSLDLEPIVILSLGYPDDEGDPGRHSEKRKSLSEIVRYAV